VNVMRGDDELEDEIMDDLVAYLVRTYCGMRGKEFCRNIMAINFTNLGKGVRPTFAVLLDKKVVRKKGSKCMSIRI